MSSNEPDYNRAADMHRAPLHTPQQMAALLLDLYTFLTTLHLDPADLKAAPADGWPDLTPEDCAHFRGDYALQVLRHLPYLGGRAPQYLHYQCEVVDYTAVDRAWFVEHHMDSDTDEWWSTLSQVPAAWMLPLALGVGREASSFYLNVVDAEVCEVVSGLGDDGPKPLAAWVDEMKQLFACLRLIPCDGKLMLVCEEVEDTEERIGEDQFRAEEGCFPTDLDVRFIRQVYREYGWPERFRYKEAMAYLLPVVEEIAEDNDERWWMDRI
ncbi:hypothetical protein A9K55_006901 [Cordyceps militaris]|uniref:Uncharacterized protein n=1 Tax=Cordyceps militaris TaxID=73501 RepID=A0A2H4SBV6_CORMI|nr:hypothetical protein A9K55_006901 [Cordyceps militaris]